MERGEQTEPEHTKRSDPLHRPVQTISSMIFRWHNFLSTIYIALPGEMEIFAPPSGTILTLAS